MYKIFSERYEKPSLYSDTFYVNLLISKRSCEINFLIPFYGYAISCMYTFISNNSEEFITYLFSFILSNRHEKSRLIKKKKKRAKKNVKFFPLLVTVLFFFLLNAFAKNIPEKFISIRLFDVIMT